MGSGALEFKNFKVGANRPLNQFHPPQPTIFDDFLGDTLDANLWTATTTDAAGAGSSAFAIASGAGDPSAGHGGWISGTCSDNDGGSAELGIMAATTVGNFVVSRATTGPLVFDTAISLPAITAIRVNLGLSDDEAEANAVLAASISGTTWTTTATNAALWVFDTAATTDVFYGMSVNADADGTAVTGVAPAATTWTRFRIEIDSLGNAYFHQGTDDAAFVTRSSLKGRQATAVATTADLIPYLGIANEGAANKTLEVDYVFITCPR